MKARLRCTLLALGWLTTSAAFAEPTPSPYPELAPRFASFLEEVELLISDDERAAFLALGKDFQRDEFIRRFWKARDPYPKTARNELQEAWKERVLEARQRFSSLTEERAQMLLAFGKPEATVKATCLDLLRPLEIWHYSRAEKVRGAFALVFVSRTGSSTGPFRLWSPVAGVAELTTLSAGLSSNPEALFDRIGEECGRGQEILSGLSAAIDPQALGGFKALLPHPGDEWLRTFRAYSTELPAGAPTFAAELDLSYPGRRQSRTIVQGVLSVPRENLTELARDGARFVLDGEVLREGNLFEHFRYRFDLAGGDLVEGRFPVVFQRLLRAGEYTLVLKVEELTSGRFYRSEQTLSVPEAPSPPTALAAGPSAKGEPLREANAALVGTECSIELLSPPARLYVGRARFEAIAVGSRVARVRFELDGKLVLAKREAPYSVELDLGAAPRLHRLRAVAVGAGDEELAADELIINGGPHRFGIRLIEPRQGQPYTGSVPVSAVVDVPEGDALDRVELFLDASPVATLYQPPFNHPILIPPGVAASFVRAVAYLADGTFTEDAVLINNPSFAESVKVRMVELFTTVVDRRGRPVEDLTQKDFRVFEDGAEQEIARFERVRDQPIYAGLMLDTSGSMAEELADAVRGGLAFFSRVITPRDRAAVITFADGPRLAVRFTNDQEVLAGGLANLEAEGETALYDSLIYALYYFSGVTGKRALVLLSDGEDAGSRYRFEDVIDYARRTGVAIYPIGINLSTRQAEARLKLSRLARETGGLSFFVDGMSGIDRIYQAIEAELRAQYLIAYQAKPGGDEQRFREVEVRMRDSALEAKTISGYYP